MICKNLKDLDAHLKEIRELTEARNKAMQEQYISFPKLKGKKNQI